MTVTKEELCISALDRICRENFEQDEFSLHGAKESAVCLEKSSVGWSVYESEKNSHNDTHSYDNIVEAALDFLRRLCNAMDYNDLKNVFLDAIIDRKFSN